MERHAHPFIRALFLAAVFASVAVLAGTYPLDDLWRPAGFPTVRHLPGAAIIAGSFLAAIPDRIRRRHGPRPRPTWQGCLTAFLCGVVMMVGLALAGTGCFGIVSGAMQGGVGALAFAATAWLTAGITARLTRGVRT